MTPTRPQLAVVIAAHNEELMLVQQLEALTDQDTDVAWEVVVVDNGSTDRTSATAEAFCDRLPLRILSATRHRGAGYARNEGVASTAAPWIAFVDADDVVGEGWLRAMTTALSQHSFVAGPSELDLLNEPWVINARGRVHASQGTTFQGVFPYASSCNVGMHRTVFESAGGFDETYLRGQDLELSLRLWQAGVPLHFEPAASVHYRLRASLGDVFKQSRGYAEVVPRLLERLRSQGTPNLPSRFDRARHWPWLLANLGLLRTKGGRARWMWVAGTQFGRLQGGLAVGRLYL